jgi:glycosyltransferase involved in cell wall biosynthesis
VKRRRILSLGHSYVVGMNRRLAHEMAKVGDTSWEVMAVAPKIFIGSNDLRPLRGEPTAGEPCPVVFVNAYLTSRVHVFLYGTELRRLLAEPWSIVHCWEEPYVAAGGQVALWAPKGTPLIFYSCQNLHKRYPPPFQGLEQFAMSRAAGWTCIGRSVEENLATRPGYRGLPRARIPLGTDTEKFRPDPIRGETVRARLGWGSSGPPIVGYLGRFVAEKGLAVLQRALDQVHTPWRALFVGAGPGEGDLRAWAKRWGDRVRICNDVGHEDVPAYLNAMDVLCAPSQTARHWKEQFGRMLIEAFASGVAVIGSDSGEIPHVIQDAGLVVGESDDAGWGRALGTLLEDRGRRAELVAMGLARAHAEFAWPVVAARHLAFFESLLGSSR